MGAGEAVGGADAGGWVRRIEVRRDLAGIERVVVGRAVRPVRASEVMTMVSAARGAAAARAALERRSPPAASWSSRPTASTASPATRSTPPRSSASTGSRAATTASPRRSCTSRRWRCGSWSPGLGPRAAAAVSALLPGPVTLVVANPERRYPLACREDVNRLGVRLLGGPLAGAMCRSSRPPPTAAARRPRPASARSPAAIVAAADLAIDGGELTGLPSTVVDISRDRRTAPGGSCARAPSAGDLRALAAFGAQPCATGSPASTAQRGRWRGAVPRLSSRCRRRTGGGPGGPSCCRPRWTRRGGPGVDRHHEGEAAVQPGDVDPLLVVVAG